MRHRTLRSNRCPSHVAWCDGHAHRCTLRLPTAVLVSRPGRVSQISLRSRAMTIHQQLRAERQTGFRADIEGLRAIAVVSVLLYHADIGPFEGGYVGVDVFFVVSGFLITRLLVRDLTKLGGQVAAELLGAAGAPPVTGLGTGDRRHLDRRLVGARSAFVPLAGPRCDRGRRVCGQHGVRRTRRRLLRLRTGAVAAAALLVARRRGAVLPGVAADPDGRGAGAVRQADRSDRHDRGDVGGVVRCFDRGHRPQRAVGVLPSADQGLGAVERRRGGDPRPDDRTQTVGVGARRARRGSGSPSSPRRCCC